MQSQLPKPKDDYTKSSNVTAAIEFAPRLQLSPTAQWVRKGLWIVTQVFVFLAQLFNYFSRFFNTYKASLPGVLLILAAFIALRVVSAVLAALNDIPLVAPAFQLIGIGYSIRFVTQHLLLASRRQELSQQIQGFLNQQRKEVIRTGESEQLYKPGQIVAISGQYELINSDGVSEGREITSKKGEHFPLTPEAGMGYKLVDETVHKGNQQLVHQQENVIGTNESKQLYKPGEIVPTSGQYEVIHPDGSREGREVTATKGEHFPPTPEPGMHYMLVDATVHKR